MNVDIGFIQRELVQLRVSIAARRFLKNTTLAGERPLPAPFYILWFGMNRTALLSFKRLPEEWKCVR